jgi:hypothetical protein
VGAACSACAPGYVVDGDACVLWPVGDWTVDQWGTIEVDAVSAIAHVAEGVLLVGRTEGDLDGETSAGGADLFIALRAYEPSSNWTRQWGSAGLDEAKALAVDSAGNAFVAGNTTGAISEPNLGIEDAVLSKITAAHAIDWTAQWGTDRSDRVNGVALVGGEVVVVGKHDGRSRPHEPKLGRARCGRVRDAHQRERRYRVDHAVGCGAARRRARRGRGRRRHLRGGRDGGRHRYG